MTNPKCTNFDQNGVQGPSVFGNFVHFCTLFGNFVHFLAILYTFVHFREERRVGLLHKQTANHGAEAEDAAVGLRPGPDARCGLVRPRQVPAWAF